MCPKNLILMALLCLLSLGCAGLPTRDELERWKANVDKTLGAAAVAVDVAKGIATTATAKADEALQKVDDAFDRVEALGAPTDDAGDLFKWVVDNPAKSIGSSGSIATVLAALAVGYKRRKRALAVVTGAIGKLDPEVQGRVKEAVAAAGGTAPAVKATISAAKREAGVT